MLVVLILLYCTVWVRVDIIPMPVYDTSHRYYFTAMIPTHFFQENVLYARLYLPDGCWHDSYTKRAMVGSIANIHTIYRAKVTVYTRSKKSTQCYRNRWVR